MKTQRKRTEAGKSIAYIKLSQHIWSMANEEGESNRRLPREAESRVKRKHQ